MQSPDDYSVITIKVEVQIDENDEEGRIESVGNNIDNYKCSMTPESNISYHEQHDSVRIEHYSNVHSNENIASSQSELNQTYPVLNSDFEVQGDNYRGSNGDANLDCTFTDKARKQHARKLYTCGECGVKFSGKAKLEYHKMKHFREHHKCVLCDKAFMTQSTLKRHMKTHVGESIEKDKQCTQMPATCTKTPVMCTQAPVSCAPVTVLSPQVPEACTQTPASCTHGHVLDVQRPVCIPRGKTFTNEAGYTSNMKNLHRLSYKGAKNKNKYKVTEDNAYQPYGCRHCARTFNEVNLLKRHKCEHSGEKSKGNIFLEGKKLKCLTCKKK